MTGEPRPATPPLLATFLEAVDKHVLRLGVRDYVEIGALWQGRDDWGRDELCASLAATLARDRDEVRKIESLFKEHVKLPDRRPKDGAPQPDTEAARPPPPVGTLERRRWASLLERSTWTPRRVLAAVVAGVVLTAGVMFDLLVAAPLIDTGLATAGAVGIGGSPGGGAPRGGTAGDAERGPSEGSTGRSDAGAVGVGGANADGPRGIGSGDSSRGGPSSNQYRRVELEKSRHVTGVRPPQLRPLDWRDWAAFAVTWVILYLALRCWLLPRHAETRQKRLVEARKLEANHLRSILAERFAKSGEPLRLSYRVPEYPAIGTAALDDVATLLGRPFRRERGTDLDVDRTVRETLREGGRFRPFFEPRRGMREVLVLVDVERGDHPWLAGIERALDHLERANVALVRYRFQRVPDSLTSAHGGPPVRLRELSRRAGDAALIIISRRLSARALEGDAAWPAELEGFAVKAWVDPNPRPLEQRPISPGEVNALVRRGLRRFPWTKDGLFALAAYLASEGQPVPEPPWPTLPSLNEPRVAAAVEAWALCAALVPDATWDQLEAIRRHPNFPEIGQVLRKPIALQCLLDWVAREKPKWTARDAAAGDPESGDGRTLDLPDPLVDHLIRRGRRAHVGPREQSLEVRAHALLLEQLEATEPKDELQWFRWKLKKAAHQIVLKPEQTMARMAGFFGSAVEEEATAILEAELRRQAEGDALGRARVPKTDRERLDAMKGELGAVALREIFWGREQVTWNALVGATVVVWMMAVGLFSASEIYGVKLLLLRLNEAQFEAELPPTYELKKADGEE
jgi:hypothetical protein